MTGHQIETTRILMDNLTEVHQLGLRVWEYGCTFFISTEEAYEKGLNAIGEDEYIATWIRENTDEDVFEVSV